MMDGQPTASAAEAVARSYDRLAEWNDPALFINLKPRETAEAEAARLDLARENRPLRGRVFAVKDNIDAAGMDTTAACPAFAYRPDRSAFAVARLEAAGAIVIGKTNLDQFATGLVGVRSPYGIARNAIRADLIPGGSSSGSATAVAAGIVDFALGTDTAGSGRIPAGMNGIVGLKPSLGLVSGSGMVPACRTLDTISFFAADAAMGFEAMSVAAGYDAADPWSKTMTVRLGGVPQVLRVGISRKDQRKFFGDPHSEPAFEADLERLGKIGVTFVEIDFEPLLEAARLLYEGPWVAERYAATKPLIEEHPDAFHPTTLRIISGAKDLTAVSAFEAMYTLQALRRRAAGILAEVDVLAVPTVPRFYTVNEVLADPIALNSNLGTYTNFVNLLDLAAIAVPVGTRGDGLPSGLTLIGRSGSDGLLAGIGLALEGTRWRHQRLASRLQWSVRISRAWRSTMSSCRSAGASCARSPPSRAMHFTRCRARLRRSRGC